MSNFTEEQTELLIDLVRRYPVLYNLQHKNYFNNSIKENAWKLIGETLQKPVGDCKTRWKTIRDSYRKQTKKVGSRSKYFNEKLEFLDDPSAHRFTKSCVSVEATNAQHVSKNEELLNEDDSHQADTENDIGATRAHVKKNANENLDMVRERHINSDRTETEFLKKKRTKHDATLAEKIKKSRTQTQLLVEKFLEKKQPDPLDIFFNGLAATVKTFPPRLIVETKLAVAKLISEFELRALSYPNEIASGCSSYSTASRSSSPYYNIVSPNTDAHHVQEEDIL